MVGFITVSKNVIRTEYREETPKDFYAHKDIHITESIFIFIFISTSSYNIF